MVALLLASVLVFAATNVDDLLLLLLMFGAGGRPRAVLLGRFAGLGAIVLASFVVSLGALAVPTKWVGFFGLVPFGLGVRDLVRRRRADTPADVAPSRVTAPVVAFATLANGCDNVGVYAPLFARRPPHEMTTILVVFAVLAVVWCEIALRITRFPPVGRRLKHWGHRVAPGVLMGLGAYLFWSTGAWSVLR